MLLPESELKNYVLAARDGEIGRSRNFLFDDIHWTVRYMEVNTSKWLLGRRVLISPFAIEEPDISLKRLHVALTKSAIENAPGIDGEGPISRQYEEAYHAHFGYPNYWVGQEVWGERTYPCGIEAANERQYRRAEQEQQQQCARQFYLYSMGVIRHYHVHVTEDDVGQVADFVIDTDSWQIRYLVVDIRRWLPGPSVLLASQWVNAISRGEKRIVVNVDKALIKTAPKFCLPLTRADEAAVFDHYGLQPYWRSPWHRAVNG